MTWQTQPTGAGVVLSTRGTNEKGEDVRLTFSYEAEARMATELDDFVEALGSEQLCLDILNTKLARDAVESSSGKSTVRELVLKVEEEILEDDPNIEPDELISRIEKDKRVKKAVDEHRKQISDYVWSGTRASGGITKTAAAQLGKKLLEENPERLKELAAELGLEGFGS